MCIKFLNSLSAYCDLCCSAKMFLNLNKSGFERSRYIDTDRFRLERGHIYLKDPRGKKFFHGVRGQIVK